jgi:transposase-like protein
VKTWILTCPECGSGDLVYETGMVLGQKYRCLRCGYMGSFALEKEIEVCENGFEEGARRSGEHDA